MKLGLRIKRFLYRKIMKPNIKKLYQKEDNLMNYPEAILPNENSPDRFDIPMNIIRFVEEGNKNNLMNRLTVFPMISNIKNINKALDSLKENATQPRTEINNELYRDLISLSKNLGIASIGTTKLPKHLIFKEKAVLFDNALVLTMEMNEEKIALAPHIKTGKMIMQTYDKLGIAANKITKFLRKKGFAAQASHPLGGLVLYPPLAKDAGLGWFGRHGLLITPEYGPRVRLAAVFTNIQNLPKSDTDEHNWIANYCKTCGKCIRSCPPKAIMEEPIEKTNGLKSHTSSEKCFPYFAQNYGCTICIKVCPFSVTGYDKLKTIVKKRAKDTSN